MSLNELNFYNLKGKIAGDISQYSVACTCFSEAILEKSDLDLQKYPASEEEMKNYFAKFAKESDEPSMPLKDINSSKFTAKRIYKGYVDDPRNTDNAWIEAEIWNFHYGDQDKFDEIIPNVICALFCLWYA
jgi:hypothetical protein